MRPRSPRSLLLRAVAHRVPELPAVLGCDRLELGADDVAHDRDPTGDRGPAAAIPLLEHDGPGASWSSQVTLIGWMKPRMPSSSSRCSVRLRCSSPQRICSPVTGRFPYFAMAIRIASTSYMALTTPRL